MLKNFLVLGSDVDSGWLDILKNALRPITKIDVALSSEINKKAREKHYDLFIVDATDSKEMIDLVKILHKQYPLIPIVVVTISPTWQRARQFFLAGAVDYIRKSLNASDLLETFQTYFANTGISK